MLGLLAPAQVHGDDDDDVDDAHNQILPQNQTPRVHGFPSSIPD